MASSPHRTALPTGLTTRGRDAGQPDRGHQVMPVPSTRLAIARRRKYLAVTAAAGVLLSGATVTSLAAWLDEAWVTAGVDGAPGVIASEFEIEQSVATDAGAWFDRESAGVAGV